MIPIRFRIGKVHVVGLRREVKIEAIGHKFPTITVMRYESGEIKTTILLKEARSLNYEALWRLNRRDPHRYRKIVVELWDHLGYEDNRVTRLIRRIQEAERRLEEAK